MSLTEKLRAHMAANQLHPHSPLTPLDMGLGGVGAAHQHLPMHTNAVVTGVASAAMPSPKDPSELVGAIMMRLRCKGGLHPFDALYCRVLTNDVVAVAVFKGDKAVILEDPWDLFPSDTLITSLRLLM